MSDWTPSDAQIEVGARAAYMSGWTDDYGYVLGQRLWDEGVWDDRPDPSAEGIRQEWRDRTRAALIAAHAAAADPVDTTEFEDAVADLMIKARDYSFHHVIDPSADTIADERDFVKIAIHRLLELYRKAAAR